MEKKILSCMTAYFEEYFLSDLVKKKSSDQLFAGIVRITRNELKIVQNITEIFKN